MQLTAISALFLVLSAGVSAVPMRQRRAADAATQAANGQQATSENNKFKGLTASSSCTAGEDACVNDQFAQCVGGKFVLQACAPGTICASLPLVNSKGTSITCTTAADRDARIAAAGGGAAAGGASSAAAGGNTASAAAGTKTSAAAASTSSAAAKGGDNASNNNNNNNGKGGAGGDPQTSDTLDPAVIAKGFASDGQEQQEAGQVPSLTSTNNFINFCLTQKGKPITNGQQVKGGSCNPAPMGVIASTSNMPSSKFVSPANMDTVPANKNITLKMAINNLQTGNFVNANSNYYSAPQQVNGQGNIIGHTHFVIEKLDSLTQTKPTNPGTFAFFKGVNAPAVNGVLTVEGPALPAGAYRLSSINAAANHQPVLVAVAQHGSLDDQVYFTVSDNANGAAGNGTQAAAAAQGGKSAQGAQGGKGGQGAQGGKGGQAAKGAQGGKGGKGGKGGN